jgi:REP element-mobilizing transposase RayT
VSTFHARHLPHLYTINHPIFITFRLHGSLPPGRTFPSEINSGKAFVLLDRLLDRTTASPRYLKRPEIATLVVDAIRYRDPKQYELHSFVIMPNHVHILVTPHIAVSQLMRSLKRFTAREANRVLGFTGQSFWQEESYDRLVRNDREFARIARYIEMNPVNAGLCGAPEEFPWSSAWPISNRPQAASLPY